MTTNNQNPQLDVMAQKKRELDLAVTNFRKAQSEQKVAAADFVAAQHATEIEDRKWRDCTSHEDELQLDQEVARRQLLAVERQLAESTKEHDQRLAVRNVERDLLVDAVNRGVDEEIQRAAIRLHERQDRLDDLQRGDLYEQVRDCKNRKAQLSHYVEDVGVKIKIAAQSRDTARNRRQAAFQRVSTCRTLLESADRVLNVSRDKLFAAAQSFGCVALEQMNK